MCRVLLVRINFPYERFTLLKLLEDFAYTGTIDNCSEDLQLMIEILKLSDFWIMNRLHEEIQRLIVSKKLINIETCQKSKLSWPFNLILF